MRTLNRILPLSFLVCIFISVSFAQTPDQKAYAKDIADGKNIEAISKLKLLLKADPKDHEAHFYMGVASVNLRKKNDAYKSFNKAIELAPDNASYMGTLAYAYQLFNNKKALETAERALKIDGDNTEALYVVASNNVKNEQFLEADKTIDRILVLNPQFNNALLLRTEALIGYYFQVPRVKSDPEMRASDILTKAFESLEKFKDSPGIDAANKQFYSEYSDTLKYFADRAKVGEDALGASSDPVSSANIVNYKITSKPSPMRTESARANGILGKVRVRLVLDSDGTIKHVLLQNYLGYGLDQNVVAAAKKIKFTPKMIEGKPVPATVTVEYTFGVR